MIEILKNCVLFKGVSKENIENIISSEKPRIREYKKGEIIANQREKCLGLSVILSGKAIIQNIYENGNVLTLSNFKESDVFAEALVFSSSYEYPATVIASTNCKVMTFSKKSILNIIEKNPIFTENILSLLSDKVVLLNKKINLVKLDTIRRKISKILLDNYKKTGSLTFKLSSKQALAEEIGIPRPSLSRELIVLRDNGIIDFSLKEIVIKDLVSLEDELFN